MVTLPAPPEARAATPTWDALIPQTPTTEGFDPASVVLSLIHI